MNESENAKHKSLKIAFFIFLAACVIRGIMYAYVWKTGTFFFGFIYPFVLMLFIALSSLPIFAIQRKYKDIHFEEELEKPSRLKSFLKICGAILYVPTCLFGIPIFIEDVILTNILGIDTLFVMTSDLYVLYAVAVLCLFILLLFLYAKRGVFIDIDGTEGLKAHLPKKIKRRVLGYGVALVFVVLLIYSFWFDLFMEDGVVKQRIFIHKEYTWEDVDYYTLRAGTDGILQFVVVMNDGAKLKAMGSSVSSSNFPEEKYPNGDEDYCRHLTKQFTSMGIELKMDDWEKLYEKLDYDYWLDFAKEIRELAE